MNHFSKLDYALKGLILPLFDGFKPLRIDFKKIIGRFQAIAYSWGFIPYSLDLLPATSNNLTEIGLGRQANFTWSESMML